MASKTWKLGEVAVGGIIQVQTKGKIFTIISKEWDFSTGSRKSSNQSNAKELASWELNGDSNGISGQALSILNELTTSYHADQIWEWIKKECDIKSFW